MIKNKSIERIVFLRKTLEKLGLTWEIVKTAELKKCAAHKVIFRFYDKILKTRSVSISYRDLMNCSSNELDMIYSFTFGLLVTCYNAYAINDKDLLNCLLKTLQPYIKFNNSPTYIINSIGHIDFDYMVENLILDGVDLGEFPNIEEVM